MTPTGACSEVANSFRYVATMFGSLSSEGESPSGAAAHRHQAASRQRSLP